MDIRKFLKDSEAVSPVIGVMLMLVVTVILAAAVSSYSSGMMDTSSKAPVAAYEVEIIKDAEQTGMPGITCSELIIREVTGDPIKTEDLKLVTINPNAVGPQVMQVLPNSENTHYHTPWGLWYNGTSPFWNNQAMGSFGDAAVDFGNYTVKPGVVMNAQDWSNYARGIWNTTTGTYDGGNVTGMQAVIADWGNVSEGDFITVKLIHTPSGKVIFDSEVEVR